MSESAYLVTARKYRPLLFKDLVAQEHVTETLKNAIRLDRLAHAYLFTGPRGVGKTTAARIVAKAINCTTSLEDREDRSEPCRECVSCQSFEQGRNMNIIEIDAASNNRVEDIRDLRETVRVPPQNNRMKVYIVDEVHMLTTAAFNALLKTLEEPPPHVMFIFATTEPHKVLPTIQSRCQRFDFRRIAIHETIERLRLVSASESISTDEESLMLIARKGDGALRDALSVFDQAVSLCGTTITHAELVRALGVVDADLYFQVTDAVTARNASGMLNIVEKVVRSGYDLQEFVDGLAEHLRNFLVAVTVSDPRLIEATDADRKRITEHSSRFSESSLMSLVQIVGLLASGLRTARQPRLTLEMGLLRMAALPDSVDVRSALEKLDRLEKMAAKGEIRLVTENRTVADAAPIASIPVPAAPKPAPSPAPVATPTPEASPTPEATPTPQETPTESAPSAPASEPAKPVESLPLSPSLGDPVREHPAPPTSPSSIPPSGPTQTPPQDDGMSLFGGAPAIRKNRPRPDENSGLHDEQNVMVLEEESDATDAQAEQDSAGLSSLKTAWLEIVTDVMSSEKQLGSFLRHASILSREGKTLLLSVPDEFHAKALRNERAKLAHKLSDATGIHIERIGFRVEESKTTTEDAHEDEVNAREMLDKMSEDNPAVLALVERFGGEIVW